jgi:hypothetical protein
VASALLAVTTRAMQVQDDTTPVTELVEAFLLIEQPRQRVGHWTQALAALDSAMAPPVVALHAYYDPIADQALINLRYDAGALGDNKLGFVVEVALLAEVGMVQPAELSEGERTRFLGERLSRCTLHLNYARSVIGALSELVRRIKDQRSPRTHPPPPPKPQQLAKGTRDDLATEANAVPEPPNVPTISKHVIPRRMPSAPLPAEPQVTPHGTQPPPPSGLEITAPTFQGIGATPYLPATSGVAKDQIFARYLRGGRWVPIRIGALSLRGASLLTGALPRLYDQVDVALSFGQHRALVRGAVGKVSTLREAQTTGAAGFQVNFELDAASRRQLTALLTAARAANVTIKPPPARATRRFPVDWPVCIGTERGAIKAEALDISVGGMFVQPAFPLQPEVTLGFSVVLDDDSAPVGGRARVVRHIGDSLAHSCGIQAGYGLSILEMQETDRLRWLAFLARVERRADKRVLIGASPSRLLELQAVLEACGYAVTGGTDPGALVQLARASDRPVDVVLLDAGWLPSDASASWVESLFSARDVPCVTLQGDSRRARMAIDRILEVVV